MSVLTLYVDEVMRTLSNDGQYPFVVNDKTVDIVRFALNTGFTDVVLDENTALRAMYQRPGESQVRAQTLTYYDTDGLHNYYDWHLLSADLAEKGALMVALCILDISGGEVSEWHTTPCAVRVLSTIHTDDSDEGDDTITPTVKERVAVLESMIQRVASGAPIVVSSTSAMTDTDQIYVLKTDGKWYYHNGSAWVAGGEYGGVAVGSVTTDKLADGAVTTAKIADGTITAGKIASGVVPPVDATLTQTGAAADAKTVGDALTNANASLSHLMDIAYTKPRDLSALTYVRGWFSGEVGENITWNSIGTKTARTYVRIPLEKNSRISIRNSEDYVMRVFVCVRGADTILYKSDMTNRDVFVNPGINANGVTIGVNFSRKDNDALSDTDLANIDELFCVFYDGLSVTKNLKMPLELGTLSATSYYLYDQEGQYADFYKTMRTPHFLDVRKCSTIKLTKEFDVMTVVWYQSDYAFLSSEHIAANTFIVVPANAAFARFVMKNSNDASFDHYSDYVYVTCEGNPKILKAIDNQSDSRNMTMCYIVDGQIGRDYSGDNSQTHQMTDTTGLLRLPPNYSNAGNPVPLVVYAHGSSDYGGKWQLAIRGQVGNDEVITYLVNEGYAVFDCFGHTEAAGVPSGKGHTYGSIDCMNCYISGIRRILDVYNIRDDGIYVTGISSGGLTALNLAFNNTIPVRACAPLAPAISIFNRFLGYNEQQRKEYAWAMGFTGDDSVLVGKNGESPTANQTQPAYTQALIDYFTDNAYKTIGYNPMWNGIVGVPLNTLLEWGLEPNDQSATRLGKGDRNAQNWANVCRICKTPIKIWVADDDHNIPPEIIYNFLTTLKNGQCIGEERRVPNGEGGHYAFTSSETAHRASGKTALGIAYTDIPIYWMEMVAFFRSF